MYHNTDLIYVFGGSTGQYSTTLWMFNCSSAQWLTYLSSASQYGVYTNGAQYIGGRHSMSSVSIPNTSLFGVVRYHQIKLFSHLDARTWLRTLGNISRIKWHLCVGKCIAQVVLGARRRVINKHRKLHIICRKCWFICYVWRVSTPDRHLYLNDVWFVNIGNVSSSSPWTSTMTLSTTPTFITTLCR